MNLHDEGHLNVRAALVAVVVTLSALLAIFLLTTDPPLYLRVVMLSMGLLVVLTGISVAILELYLRAKRDKEQQRIRSEVLRRFGNGHDDLG